MSDKIYANRGVLPIEADEALEKILYYFWEDESASFESATPEQQKGHIFNSLYIVKKVV